MSEIQAVLFKTSEGWTSTKSRKWLKENSLKPIKRVHKVGDLLRYRIKEPDYKFYTTKSQKNGINFVIGSNKSFKKGKTKTKDKFSRNNKGTGSTKAEKRIEKRKNNRDLTKKSKPAGLVVKLST